MGNLRQKLRHELRELIPVTLFFFLAFELLATEPAALLGVALTEDGGKAGQKDPKAPTETVLGYILLEKQQGDSSPFSAQEEIVVAAVGQQTGLGILHAYNRQDEEARERLERNRMRWR